MAKFKLTGEHIQWREKYDTSFPLTELAPSKKLIEFLDGNEYEYSYSSDYVMDIKMGLSVVLDLKSKEASLHFMLAFGYND
jgi:hypothetical protein